jgi:hypothetical protein
MGYTAYRYICDDRCVHYCVKPLGLHYTHTNMDCTWKLVKSQIFEIVCKIEFLNLNDFENGSGFKMKSFWKRIPKIKVILNNLIKF